MYKVLNKKNKKGSLLCAYYGSGHFKSQTTDSVQNPRYSNVADVAVLLYQAAVSQS